MTNLTYNGQPISQREDGYVLASSLTKASGKRFSDYKRTKQTISFLNALSSDLGLEIEATLYTDKAPHIPAALVVYITDFNNAITDAYIHPEVVID